MHFYVAFSYLNPGRITWAGNWVGNRHGRDIKSKDTTGFS